jgi:hypothetical protein
MDATENDIFQRRRLDLNLLLHQLECDPKNLQTRSDQALRNDRNLHTKHSPEYSQHIYSDEQFEFWI